MHDFGDEVTVPMPSSRRKLPAPGGAQVLPSTHTHTHFTPHFAHTPHSLLVPLSPGPPPPPPCQLMQYSCPAICYNLNAVPIDQVKGATIGVVSICGV